MEDASPSFARLFAAAAEAASGGYDPIETDSDLAEAMGESRQRQAKKTRLGGFFVAKK